MQEFEAWMEDKENVLDTFSPDADSLAAAQAKYEVRSNTKLLEECRSSWETRIQIVLFLSDNHVNSK